MSFGAKHRQRSSAKLFQRTRAKHTGNSAHRQ
jgi:hypothetical protein